MAAHQAPLSLGFSRWEHWSELPFPSTMHACMPSLFSCILVCATPWTAAHQAPLSTGFSRQEYWSGLPFPSPFEALALIILLTTVWGDAFIVHIVKIRKKHTHTFTGSITRSKCSFTSGRVSADSQNTWLWTEMNYPRTQVVFPWTAEEADKSVNIYWHCCWALKDKN